MKKLIIILLISLAYNSYGQTQSILPMDTNTWKVAASAHIFENYRGQDAIYLQGGSIVWKGGQFLNGTIEYDIFLKQEQAFPGIYFRAQEEEGNAEHFYIRPHLPGKPDANQVLPLVNGLAAWQLNFGPRYSFPYDYKYDDWTHVKILVNGDKAQIFLDHSETPHISWDLYHETKAGKILLQGGNRSGMHIANVSIIKNTPELIDFNPVAREPIENLVPQWEISDKFEEALLENPERYDSLLKTRKWQGKIAVDEGTAVNISKLVERYNDTPGNTVFARITVNSAEDQMKLFEFGYSDRVVVFLNGQPLYWGSNRYRSRDYRYLGTIGLFDAVYLPLKRGNNTLVMAVSEDFGGWLVTGRFKDNTSVKVK